jgi:very-short-patch-repair endonuclease
MAYLYNDQELKTKRRNQRNNMPAPEQALWYYLKGRNLKGYKFRRQFSVSNFILDFFCPQLKLGIEIDGDSHFLNNQTIGYDRLREQFLEKEQIKLLRFTNDEVKNNLESVIEKILAYLP